MLRSRKLLPFTALEAFALSAFALLTFSTASAQEAATQEEAKASGIEELMVTARRREESSQTVPVALTALSGDRLNRMHANDLRELSGMAPNILIEANGGTTQNGASMAIRGIQFADIERSFDPAIGVVVDNFPLVSNTQQNFDMFDIERVEILRGPQGTLFGKNTIGGTIVIHRKKPTADEFGGEVEFNFGRFGRADVRTSLNIPLIEDKLAARISVLSQNSSGYIRNLFDGSKLNGEKLQSIRVALNFTPNEDFDFLISYEHVRDRSDALGEVVLNKPDKLFCIFFAVCSVDLNDPKSFYVANQNGTSPGRPSPYFQDTNTVIAEANWDVGAFLITNVFGYRDVKENLGPDFDGSPFSLFSPERAQDQSYWSEELRIASQFSEKFDFVAGLFYQDTHYRLDEIFHLEDFGVFLQSIGGLPPGVIFTQDGNFEQDAQSWAVFIQGNYNITDKLRFTAGVRYTEEKKTFSALFLAPSFLPPFLRQSVDGLRDNWSEATPRFGLDYQVSEDIFAFFSYARGFKSGGFNGRSNSISSGGPYDPEKVEAYEVGFKTDWLENRLRINFAAFWNNYKDMQMDVVRPVPGVASQETIVDNAASATTKGVEIELTALPADNFTIFASVGYLKAGFDDFCADFNGPDAIAVGVTPTSECGEVLLVGPDPILPGIVNWLVPTDNSALLMRRAPKWQFSVGGQYDIVLANSGTISVNLNYQWNDDFEMTANNVRPYGIRKAVGLLNGSITFTNADENIEISLYGKNLTNERYLNSAISVANLFEFGAPNIPRRWGVVLSFKY